MIVTASRFGAACNSSEFFDYLDRTEISEFEREFHPVSFGCCRAAWIEPLNKIMKEMKELAKQNESIQTKI